MTTLVLAVGLLAAQASSSPIGLAMTGGAGASCVAMPGTTLPRGSVVTLTGGDSPQTVVTAAVGETIATCGLDTHVAGGPYFSLQLRGPVPEHSVVWVALRGELPTRVLPSGRLSARLSAEYPSVQIHSCTSSEGVHYTAWAGTPLESRRLWHAYYYLGYDVEPSCKQRTEVED